MRRDTKEFLQGVLSIGAALIVVSMTMAALYTGIIYVVVRIVKFAWNS